MAQQWREWKSAGGLTASEPNLMWLCFLYKMAASAAVCAHDGHSVDVFEAVFEVKVHCPFWLTSGRGQEGSQPTISAKGCVSTHCAAVYA